MSGSLELSEVQKRIVDHDKGHLRIVACPGSGKTEVVSRRVVQLIKKGVDPASIVAFTFTEKAAEGLKIRIRKNLEREEQENPDFGEMYIGTIDSFCLYTLKQLKPKYRSFDVLNSARRTAFIDRWYYHMGLGDLQDETHGKWSTMRTFADSVDRVMTERVDVKKITNATFVGCYEAYTEKLKDERFFDFTSIIFTLLELIKSDPDARAQLRDSIKHVVFDEYQDVNNLQEELLRILSEGADSVCVVGDDDQNIFQWRGSDVDYILKFEGNYEKYNVTTEALDINYRATSGLIDTANRLVRNNKTRVEKNMRVYEKQTRQFEQGDIMQHHFPDDYAEFDFILKTVRNLHQTEFTDKYGDSYGMSYRDMAVIVRSNDDAARIVNFFTRNNIPCIAESGSSAFEIPIVSFAADCIFYVFGHDGYIADGVPEIEDMCRRYDVLFGGGSEEFMKKIQRVKEKADEITAKGYKDWLPNLGLQEFFQRILNAMGAEQGVFSESDMYNLAVLSTAISDYEYVYRTLRAREVSGLKWFILQFAESYYSDPMHNDPTLVDAIRVLTIWKAKGLEFPVVFVPSFVARQPPQSKAYFVDDKLYEYFRYDGDIEDERRAYYTAITRSQKYLFLTGASKRKIVARRPPSKRDILPHGFIEELRNEAVSPLGPVSRPKIDKESGVQSEGTFPTSYSELSDYDRCPYDYKLRHILGFNPGIPAAFGYGLNMHHILNQIHSDYIRNKKIPTDEDIDKIFNQLFRLRFAPDWWNEKIKQTGSRVVKNYVDLHKDGFDRILDTEKHFEFVMGKALVSGYIDLLKRTGDEGDIKDVEIIDFKTEQRENNGGYEVNYSDQVRFYAHATRMSLGYLPERALVHHLDTQEKEYIDISAAKLDGVRDEVKEKVENILSGNFEPAPDQSKCKGCDFRALCQHKGFDVGVGFEPIHYAEKSGSVRADDDVSPEQENQKKGSLPPIVSDGMRRTARRLADGMVLNNFDGTFRVASATRDGESYVVTLSKCHCRGFKNYRARHPETRPTCSHIEAVKIFQETLKSRQ